MLVEVECTLNSRPFTYLYEDEVDTDVITPLHLIFAGRLTSMPEESTNQVSDDVGDVKRRFRYLVRMKKHFWWRWRKEYLSNLREFRKVKRESLDAKVGDVVLVFNENLKRGCWSVGRI